MKFVKEVTGEKMAIPAAALKLCGFENGDKAELHALPSAAIILKQKMTAMEVIQAIILLEQLRTIDKSRLRDKLSSLGEDQMCKLDHALEVSVGLLPIYNTI